MKSKKKNENIKKEKKNKMNEKMKEQEIEKNISEDENKEAQEQKGSGEKKELSLEEQLQEAIRQRDEFKDKYLRSVAEFENFRKRSLEEKSSWIKNATQQLVLELCDVMDNFERALQTEAQDHQHETFRKGVDMIFKQLENILKKEGVEKIDATGKIFDPAFHEALASVPSELEENMVTAIIQNGYLMNEKLLRPARVAVSNGEKPQQKENENKKEK